MINFTDIKDNRAKYVELLTSTTFDFLIADLTEAQKGSSYKLVGKDGSKYDFKVNKKGERMLVTLKGNHEAQKADFKVEITK